MSHSDSKTDPLQPTLQLYRAEEFPLTRQNQFNPASVTSLVNRQELMEIIPDLDSSHLTVNKISTANLSIQRLINQRYAIEKLIHSRAGMNFYLVKDLLASALWCGYCGIKVDREDFCPRCGQDLLHNHFLMIEGDRHSTNPYKELILREIRNEGILAIFERFQYEGKFYVISTQWGGQTLADISRINPVSLLNWSLVLGEALSYLHANGIFQPELTLESIFLRPDGPQLAGFTKCKFHQLSAVNSRRIQLQQRRDLVKFSRMLLRLTRLTLTSKTGKGLVSVIRDLVLDTISGKIVTLKALLEEFQSLKQHSIQPPVFQEALTTNTPSVEKCTLLSGKATHTGLIRSLNEDSVATYQFSQFSANSPIPVTLGLVADGMGGHQNGEIASKIAIEIVANQINRDLFLSSSEMNFGQLTDFSIRKIMLDAILAANEKVYQIARAKESDMGTTLTAALVIGGTAYIINVGDTRAYYFNGNQLHHISEDHSLVYLFYKQKRIEYAEIRQHPQRNQILRCLGEKDLEKNLRFMAEKYEMPYLFTQPLTSGDSLLLCSDGIWELVSEDEITEILNTENSPQNASSKLIELANQHGGRDNISVVIIKME
ncbi:protein phosphatase 2C domain-containing protein [candidate division KSB1 bacterium]|nr:protein phosphatase 2C domain-containing protein [candidate division KSB1 bacterium]